MGTVLYKDFIAFGSPLSFSWGVLNTGALLKTVEDFSSEMVPNKEVQNSGELPSSESTIHNILFFSPLPMSDLTVIDGPVYGNVCAILWNCADGAGVWLKKIYVNVVKVSSSGVVTSLIGGEILVWSGTIVVDTGVYPSGPVTQKVIVPFWATIDLQEITREYRIGLIVRIAGYAQTYYGDPKYNRIYVGIDSSTKQTFMSLPIALSSD